MSFTVETDVPYGNACQVEVDASTDPATVAFAPAPHGGPEVLWFCFRVRRIAQIAHRTMTSGRIVPAPRKIKLVLKNPGTMLGGGTVEAMRPVARYERGDWERLGPGTREELDDGRVMGTWTIDAPATFVDMAYCYPYGMPELEALLEESRGALAADTIGASQQGRPIVRVSNSPGVVRAKSDSAVAKPGQPESGRPGLYLVSRQHSAETPGSWVLDGFLREVASMTEKGKDTVPLVWAVPLSNIDGIEQGDYGKDNFPYDLNRAWGSPPMRHETLVIRRDMDLWKGRCRPAAALDFHAPGACETDGIYAYLPDPEEFPRHVEAANEWAAALGEALGEYAAEEFGRVARYASRWETPNFTSHCREAFGIPALTLETPYASCGGRSAGSGRRRELESSNGGEVVMTRERYQEAGARLARAVVEKIAGRP